MSSADITTTVASVKLLMGYTEEQPVQCVHCKHSREEEDQAGLWYFTCRLNPAVTFTVKRDARCKHFE